MTDHQPDDFIAQIEQRLENGEESPGRPVEEVRYEDDETYESVHKIDLDEQTSYLCEPDTVHSDWPVETFKSVFSASADRVVEYDGRPAVIVGFDYLALDELSQVRKEGYEIASVRRAGNVVPSFPLVAFKEAEDYD